VPKDSLTREEAIKLLEHIGLTREEAEATLEGSEEERVKIIRTVQERHLRKHESLPMSIEEGPPLPRKLGIYWPWYSAFKD
jgi:hypothetical protein